MQLWWNVYDKNRLCKHTNQFHKQPCDLPTFKSFFPFFFQLVTDTFEQKRQTILISLVCLLFFLFTTHFEAKNCRGWKCTRHQRCENQLLPVPKIVQEKLKQPLNWVFPRLAPVLWSFFLSAADLPCNSSCSFCWREPWRKRGAMKLVTRNVKI